MIPAVIGLKGRAGSGKSTAAQYLVARHGYAVVKFAGALKSMLSAIGLTVAEIEGCLKEQPCDLLCGRTPREAMILLGTEWGRELIHPELWIRLWKRRAEDAMARGAKGIVADDCRFYNEAAAVRDLGGIVIEIRKQSDWNETAADSLHVSEVQNFPADVRMINEGFDKSILHARLEGALSYIERVGHEL